MKKQDPLRTSPPCNKETGPPYLGDLDQIEEFLGFRHVTETRDQSRKIADLQPEEGFDSALEETK